MGFFEQFHNILSLLMKTLTVAFLSVFIIWFFALIGLLNNKPVPSAICTAAPCNGVTLLPFPASSYITSIFLPIVILVALVSLLAEKRMSNDYLGHPWHTVLGTLAIASLITLIFAFAPMGWLVGILGFVLTFWLSFAILFVLYYTLK